MRNKGDSESSLELLLDTMCNTFGGIIFIAIALSLMLGGAKLVREKEADNPLASVEAMAAELAELQQQTQQQLADLKLLSRDPRMRLQQEVLTAENILRQQRLSGQLSEEKIRLQKKNLLKLQRKNSQLRTVKQQLQSELERQQLQLRDLQQRKIALAEEKKQLTAEAPVMLSRRKMANFSPYFLLIFQNKIYRVGPGPGGTPESDVNFQESGLRIHCTPKPEAGELLCDASGEVRPEILSLIGSITGTRRPWLLVSKESLPTFCKLRRQLQKQHIRNSWTEELTPENIVLVKSNQKEFYY